MFSKALATCPDTKRSPKHLPGEDISLIRSTRGFLRLRRPGVRPVDVAEMELPLSSGELGTLASGVTTWAS